MTVLYKDSDPCTDMILDFIRQLEAKGNYNAVIYDADSTDDLSQKTIAGIYYLMDYLNNIGRPSTAVGGYQFVKNTLQYLQQKAHLPLDTRFTPELQDQLAWMLLCRHDYQRWWKDEISTSVFLHNLSKEWASLPDPYLGGKSHYDGIGPNHAGATLGATTAMLLQAKKRIHSS